MARKKHPNPRLFNNVRDELDRLRCKLDMRPVLARQIGLRDTELLSPFMVMLAFAKAENPTAFDVSNNGTGALVDTGRIKLLVTNHHVCEAFGRHRTEMGFAKLVMCGRDGRPGVDVSDDEIIDSDRDCDLATIAVSPEKVALLGKRFFRLPCWPPERPRLGTRVVVVGYPGQGREPSAADTLGVRPLSIGRRVSSVSEKQFVMADETQDAYSHVPDGGKPLTSYGGISGSPAYSVHGQIGTTFDYRLCGFVREEGFGHTLVVAHADHINADGKLR